MTELSLSCRSSRLWSRFSRPFQIIYEQTADVQPMLQTSLAALAAAWCPTRPGLCSVCLHTLYASVPRPSTSLSALLFISTIPVATHSPVLYPIFAMPARPAVKAKAKGGREETASVTVLKCDMEDDVRPLHQTLPHYPHSLTTAVLTRPVPLTDCRASLCDCSDAARCGVGSARGVQ